MSTYILNLDFNIWFKNDKINISYAIFRFQN